MNKESYLIFVFYFVFDFLAYTKRNAYLCISK